MKKPSHLNQKGEAHMVDISQKEETKRKAKAEGFVKVKKSTIETIKKGNLDKGDLFGSARIAGIMAAKRTDQLIPLCHAIPLSYVNVDLKPEIKESCINIKAEAALVGKTGVEMEAFTAVSIAALTIYDMCKSIDREMVISDIKLIHKSGGKSGEFNAKV